MSENQNGFAYYAQVESVVSDILNDLGYEAMQDISGLSSVGWLVTTVSDKMYKVFIHISKERQISDQKVWSKMDENPYTRNMEIFVGVISDQMRERMSREYPNHILLDLCNLLYMVQGNPELRNKLVSVLNFSVDDIVPVKPDERIKVTVPKPHAAAEDVKTRLHNWNPCDESSTAYEKLCCKALKSLFADDLTLWREQQKSDGGLFRFDLICKIKRGNNKDFWETAERYFHSKYIVFEFKNYSGKVTQKEVFTTVKYLYAKALRGIAILISPNGTDDHADMALRGILREEGKLILSLTNDDLEEMLKGQNAGRNPADYLSDKLDDLLIDLEK